MAGLHDYTTKEVLNKVLLDSSGDAVAAFSHTTQEALNAVLDTTNNRLNVSIAGGTISGDLTIAGDLTVQGDGSGTYSEIITGVLQISNTTINGAPINLLSRDTAIDSDQEGVRIRFGKSDDSFLADYGYRRWTSSDKGATITSTDNLRLVLTGQNVSHFMFKGNNSTVGSVLDIRTHETTVEADDVLGKITFSAPYEASSTDAILAGAEIKALATDTFRGDNNKTDLIFSTASSDAEHGSATSGAVFERMRITSAGFVSLGGDADTGFSHATDALSIKAGGEVFTFGTNGLVFNNNAGNHSAFVSGAIASATVPVFSFNGDTNTGIGGSADTLNLITGGASRMIIDSSGKTGIGTIAPTRGLHIINSAIVKAGAIFELTGDINPVNGSTTVPGTSTLFLSEVSIGDTITVTGETRTVTAIASDTSLTVDTTFSSGLATDTTPQATPAAFTVQNSGGTANLFKLDANSRISLGNNDSGGDTTNTVFGNLAGNAIASGGVNNSIFGSDAGNDITTGDKNTLVGWLAGDKLSTTSQNVVVGAAAGRGSGYADNVYIGYAVANSTSSNSSNNTLIGSGVATSGVMSGGNNTAVGKAALSAVTSGANNVAIGVQALTAEDAGSNNTAIGTYALQTQDAGADAFNVGLGYAPGASLTTGVHNIAIGYAMTTHQTGSRNIAIGHTAMNDTNATAAADGGAGGSAGTLASSDNVFIGFLSGGGIWAGSDSEYNVAIGNNTLSGAMDGAVYNVALGHDAGKSITTGSGNIVIGVDCGDELTTGGDNVLIGYGAGHSLVEGTKNVAVGYLTLDGGDEDSACVAIGYQALTAANVSDTGTAVESFNTAVGYQAGVAVSDGLKNTLIGAKAGNLIAGGDENTIIGYDCDVDDASRHGCIIIGNSLSLNTASHNVVEIGNNTNSMTYDLDGGDITVTSDVRTKKNIKGTKLGLEFINKLRPITYQTKPSSQYPKEFGIKNPSKKSSNKTWDGLIAQEVKEVMDDMDVGFSGWEEGVNTKQRLAYGKFVMPLIKAVQELSSKVEELEAKLSK